MDAVFAHFAAHHGVISRAEARACGMSNAAIGRRVASGTWLRLAPGVFRLAGAPATWFGDARASALATAGLVSHRAAARVWGLDGFDRATVELTVATSRNPLAPQGVRMHRSTQLALADDVIRRGVPITGCARTVLDLAAVVGRVRLHATIDDVLRKRMLRWHDLVAVLVRHSRRGRDGCGKLRAALDERYGEKRPPDSAFNRMVGQLLIDASVGRPVFEHELFDGERFVARIDLAFPAERLAIELDSRLFHDFADDDPVFVNDRRRGNRIVNLDWTLLRFTWDDYRETPHVLVQTVRDALRRLRSADL